MGTRTSGLAPWTKTLREPGIGRVTDAESSPASWTSEAASGMAFIGVVLGRPRGIRGTERSEDADARRGRRREASLRRCQPDQVRRDCLNPRAPGARGYPRFADH